MSASPEGTHLEPCPWCGSPAVSYDDLTARCSNRKCHQNFGALRFAEWNRRAPRALSKEEAAFFEDAKRHAHFLRAGVADESTRYDVQASVDSGEAFLRSYIAMVDSSKGGGT